MYKVTDWKCILNDCYESFKLAFSGFGIVGMFHKLLQGEKKAFLKTIFGKENYVDYFMKGTSYVWFRKIIKMAAFINFYFKRA